MDRQAAGRDYGGFGRGISRGVLRAGERVGG